MSDAQINDQTDPEVEGEDSPIIQKLRKQVKDGQKELVELRKAKEESDARETQSRADRAKQYMDAAGYPTLDVSILTERITGDVTADAVNTALKAIGLQPRVEGGQEAEPAAPAPAPRVPASEMGQRVAEVASGSPVKDIDSRLAAAVSQAEIVAIMAEAGLTASHSV